MFDKVEHMRVLNKQMSALLRGEYFFGITITVLRISQNNDNRGRHLEFYFHTGIGNWFQCFPVYPGLNLSSGSGSGSVFGSGSGFRIPAFPYAHFFSTVECDHREKG